MLPIGRIKLRFGKELAKYRKSVLRTPVYSHSTLQCLEWKERDEKMLKFWTLRLCSLLSRKLSNFAWQNKYRNILRKLNTSWSHPN